MQYSATHLENRFLPLWFLQCFVVKLACRLDTQLGQWMDYLYMQWKVDVTYMALACKNGPKFPILILGTVLRDRL